MSEPTFDPDRLIDALAPLLGLTLSDASRAQVRLHVAIAAARAETLREAPLADDAEPAPVFTP